MCTRCCCTARVQHHIISPHPSTPPTPHKHQSTSKPIEQEDPALTRNWKKIVKVAVTGASGQISNHLLFMLASGEVFGRDQPVALQLLGSQRSRCARRVHRLFFDSRCACLS
jgi:hypothetical protein